MYINLLLSFCKHKNNNHLLHQQQHKTQFEEHSTECSLYSNKISIYSIYPRHTNPLLLFNWRFFCVFVDWILFILGAYIRHRSFAVRVCFCVYLYVFLYIKTRWLAMRALEILVWRYAIWEEKCKQLDWMGKDFLGKALQTWHFVGRYDWRWNLCRFLRNVLNLVRYNGVSHSTSPLQITMKHHTTPTLLPIFSYFVNISSR